jgi:hypothetical protein
VLNSANLSSWSVNTPGYNQTLTASGGTGTYTFFLTSGSLPPGLSLAAQTGNISGTPTMVGVFDFTAEVTDSAGVSSAPVSFSISINQGITISPPGFIPGADVTVPYSLQVTASGGSGTLTLFLTSSSSLPPGLTAVPNAQGLLISGIPTMTGLYSFTVVATDQAGGSGSQSYLLSVSSPPQIATTSLPPWDATAPGYNQTLQTNGGTWPYTYKVTSGALPAGLVLNPSSGQIGGTPTTKGTSSFTITVTDAVGGTAAQGYTVQINAPLAITTSSLPGGFHGFFYSQKIATSGGTPALHFFISSGSLPPGLSLNFSTGVLSGTPRTGRFTFTIEVTDAGGGLVMKSYTITIV